MHISANVKMRHVDKKSKALCQASRGSTVLKLMRARVVVEASSRPQNAAGTSWSWRAATYAAITGLRSASLSATALQATVVRGEGQVLFARVQ